jgi:hypothetical protein
MRRFTPAIPIMSAKADTGSGAVQLVEDFIHYILAMNTASSANLTVKVQGSIADVEPTWANAASPTNQWDYVQMKDLEDGSSVDGDTGFAPAGTDDQRMFEVNVNGLKWLNVIVTARSAGNVTVIGKGFCEQ